MEERWRVPVVSVGDVLRKEIASGSPVGREAASHREPLTAALWLDLDEASIAHRVSRRVTCADCGRSFQIGWHVGGHTDACPVCGGRLTVRKDDDPATLLSRMEQYKEHTAPVKDFYAARGLLRVIDAGRTPEEVFAEIERASATPQEAAAA